MPTNGEFSVLLPLCCDSDQLDCSTCLRWLHFSYVHTTVVDGSVNWVIPQRRLTELVLPRTASSPQIGEEASENFLVTSRSIFH